MGFLDTIGGGAAISGASGLVSGLINKIGQKKTEERQVGYQKELADYQYQKDYDMWSESNEYNKPENQMQRLKEAGLNPHLVYGSGSATGNTAQASTPKYQNPGTQFKNVPIADPNAMLQNYMQLKTNSNQNKLLQAQERYTNARAGTEVFNTILKELAGKKAGLDLDYMPKTQAFNWNIQQGILDQQDVQWNKTFKEYQSQRKKNTFQDMINTRAKDQKIFPGDNNAKTIFQMLMGGKTVPQFYNSWKSKQGAFGRDYLPYWE